MVERFSARHGFQPPEAPITVRHDAPDEAREVLLIIAEEAGFQPSALRRILCRVLRVAPDPSNWSEYPNVYGEVRSKLRDADWWEVYDFVEALDQSLARREDVSRETLERGLPYFRAELNKYFRKAGIGWQLVDGRIEVRGPEVTEQTLHTALEVLKTSARDTAARELREAVADLSRRPEPDVTGAIQHSLAALECAARHVSGRTETLGALVERDPSLFPAPLDQAVKKLFGFASEMGRHLQEGRAPSYEDAELTVALAAALTTHLVRRST